MTTTEATTEMVTDFTAREFLIIGALAELGAAVMSEREDDCIALIRVLGEADGAAEVAKAALDKLHASRSIARALRKDAKWRTA